MEKLDAGTTAKNSSSLRRAPGPPLESTRGSSSNFPFWPGGFDEPEVLDQIGNSAIAEDLTELLNESKLLSCPPGFDHGVDFSQIGDGLQRKGNEDPDSKISLAETLIAEEDALGLWSERATEHKGEMKNQANDKIEEAFPEAESFDIEEPDTNPVIKITETSAPKASGVREWAELIDISQPVLDFHQKVPQMAYTWPFELDTFQKQAVVCLERNQSVFVAAHTSAGKTVVAEYAIALSQKHMTRTIYTSPIKALSNQKFRDFKVKTQCKNDMKRKTSTEICRTRSTTLAWSRATFKLTQPQRASS